MDHFDRYTNYNDQSGVSSVVFGSGKSVLEVELNEIQEIFKTSLHSIIAGVCGNGITDASKITYTSDTFNIASGCYIAVDGILINCTGLSKTISSGNIYLQVWEDTVDFRSVLKKQGNQDSNETVTNYIKDNRSSEETTRRKVIKYTLATSQDNTKHNLLIATVANGTCEIKIPEINLSKLKESLNNAMVRTDAPDEEGKSQLFKIVNGQRVDIEPKVSDVEGSLSDATFAAKMDEQIGILTNIAKKLGYNEWKEIQKMVRNGTFADHYSVGDQLTVKYNGNDTLWDIVAIDVATPADTTKTHSVTLMPHDCLDALMFDNKEPNNPDSNRKSYGNNRYKESNIRLYLNSSGAAGTWWSSQGTYDAAPDYATTKAGFMSNFESDFLEVIGKTKIRVAKNTVTDGGGYEDLSDEYFYLASETEVGLGNENNIAEGSTFPYFSDNAKRIKNYNGSAKYWWLRTPDASYSDYARYVGTDGSLYNFSAYYARGLAAACNII